jgi:hypothetical protein
MHYLEQSKNISVKNIMFALFLIMNIRANAQTNYTPAGTWRYINGLDTIEVYLKSQLLTDGNESIPVIIGFHRYVKNGQLVESNIAYKNSLENARQYSILMYNGLPHDTKQEGTLKDITLGNERMIFTEKINPTTIKVTLHYIHGVRNNRPYGFTLPRNFILTKQ